MATARKSRVLRAIPLLIAVCLISFPAYAQYSGGTGEPNDPYQIATAEDLMLLGESPEDYDKHFILTADIDLNPNLPGRKVFDRAVIAADTNDVEPGFQGIPFAGVFDGNLHDISHMTMEGESYLGLFGQLESGAKVFNLGVEVVDVRGTDNDIGGLAGYNLGAIHQCSITGTVKGNNRIGGLVGHDAGPITKCSTNGQITGNQYVGGLVGFNWTADILACFSNSRVVGRRRVGGLVGISGRISSPPAGLAGPPPGSIPYPPISIIASCYSTGYVEGGAQVGGLAGENRGSIQFSYSTARVENSGLLLVDQTTFGGLVGTNNHGVILLSYWDAEVSHLPYSTAGKGKTTEQMMNADTFSGWGYTGEWIIDEGNDYPRLAWEGLEGKAIIETPNRYSGGTGTPDDPYKIQTSDELIRLSNHPIDWDKCFMLTGNIDFDHVDPNLISPIGVYGMPFKGLFNGNHYTIFNFQCLSETESYIGVFGSIGPEISYRSYAPVPHDPNDSGSVINLKIENVRVLGYSCAGGLAGYNSGIISNCSVTGNVTAVSKDAGGLLGFNDGEITDCYALGNVKSELVAGGLIGHNKGPIKGCSFSGSVEEKGTHGGWCSGGLIGYNYSTVESCHFNGNTTGSSYTGGLIGLNGSTVSSCFASGNVTGTWCVGGLVGRNGGTLMNCYAIGSVNGTEYVAGLAGLNDNPIICCYSSCTVTGQQKTGGLVGKRNYRGEVSSSFWDFETSGQITSAGGTGKITAEMQTSDTFLDAGWDFVDETANGTEDIWWILEGLDYPRLWWEAE